MDREVQTRIAEKFQVTVPLEIRDIFDLRVGDIFGWRFNSKTGIVELLPKRAQLITPQLRQKIRAAREQVCEQFAQPEDADVGVEEELKTI